MKTITLMAMLLQCSCSYVTYTGRPDGSTTITGLDVGTDRALQGAEFKINRDGERSLKIDSLDSNRIKAVQMIDAGIKLLVGAAH
jgi:hypothetical protein